MPTLRLELESLVLEHRAQGICLSYALNGCHALHIVACGQQELVLGHLFGNKVLSLAVLCNVVILAKVFLHVIDALFVVLLSLLVVTHLHHK